MNENKNFVITIGRQFGSGGRELGKLLASTFGIEYYDKELLQEAAKQAGMSPEFFAQSDERAPSFLSGMFAVGTGYNPASCYSCSSSLTGDSVYCAQSEFIRKIANEKSCVIVGRSADYVLREHPRCVNIFVHSSEEDCIARIMRRGDKPTPEQARTIAHKTNKLRANYYNFYTDKRWGDAASYDLTLNTSLLKMEDAVAIIAEYIRRRFNVNPY
ncbi:MAG: cytidylate kinase-like family protein [Muribaculaceae bacterium]|jgi:cytidylate kinase|nr:cytidylate kinase-like family protein [Muribaculaceae bacterium]